MMRLLMILAILALPGCAGLATYERTYSLSYSDAHGQTVAASVRLKPEGLAK